MSKEMWRDVPGYEGLYQVSNTGAVKSLAREVKSSGDSYRFTDDRILKPARRSVGGYMEVALTKDGKMRTHRIHKLVMAAFVGDCPAGQEVRHLNCDPGDNRLENLAYGTRSDNMLDSGRMFRLSRQKLTRQDAENIRAKIRAGARQVDLAKEYGVSLCTVNAIHKNRIHRREAAL